MIYYQQKNKLPEKQMNESYASMNAPYRPYATILYAHNVFGVQLYKNNPLAFFRVFWVSWIKQLARCVRGVYGWIFKT